MFSPNLLSTLPSASSALAISAVLLLSPNVAAQQGSPLAQASPNLEDTPAALEPPYNPRPTRGTLTTTGTYFRPPDNPRPRSGSRTTTGTRQGGCLGNTETAFTILGPEATVGKTLSSHPEFVWYLPESDVTFPVVFRLLAPNEAGIPTPVHTAELSYTAGFTSYQLPSEVPALVADKEYRWQVVVACNPNYPSRSLAQELSFEVVPLPAGLAQSIPPSASAEGRALTYGQAGLWYDAIALVARATTPAAVDVRMGLLRDLAAIEMENEQLSQDIFKLAEMSDR